MKDLRDSNAVGHQMGDGVKLLSRGAASFNIPVHLQVGAFPADACICVYGGLRCISKGKAGGRHYPCVCSF
jgi:hypothetical protein